MPDCIFCKIIAGDIPTKEVYADENVLVFWDISPAKAVHVLIVPKIHIASLAKVAEDNSAAVSACLAVIPKLIETLGLEDGFRLISNCGEYGGQTVHHLHFHLFGGEKLPVPII